MPVDLNTAHSTTSSQKPSDGSGNLQLRVASFVAELRRWFGVEFQVLDGTDGRVLHKAASQPARDWDLRAAVCCEVAKRGQPELIEDEAPLATLAVPSAGNPTLVGVATFLVRTPASNTERFAVTRILGLDADAAENWISQQRRWAPKSLVSMAQVVMAKAETERWATSLAKETDDLSLHLSMTYEEINLLYRLIQNLQLTSNDEDLGRLALEWLSDVLPAESLALLLLAVDQPSIITPQGRTETVMLTHGLCPIESKEFQQLADQLGLASEQGPLIVNRATTDTAGWRFSAIRDMIAVPLSNGGRNFGWLAAFNHRSGGEFGSAEASLLNSVGTILAIHSDNGEVYRQQGELLAGVIRALTSAIDAKDPYTCGHSQRVARVAVQLGQEMGLDSRQLNTVYLSGLLHDIGKIGIDDSVLRKPGKLTRAEYEHIKTHAEIGYRILIDLKQLDDVLPVVLHHHEQWDGCGYPNGLAGEDIPLLARIVAVADAFDAMRSDRPYRSGLPKEQINAILREGAGKQWDARIVDVYFRIRDDIPEISKPKHTSPAVEIQWI